VGAEELIITALEARGFAAEIAASRLRSADRETRMEEFRMENRNECPLT
jgi:hypothetical protein